MKAPQAERQEGVALVAFERDDATAKRDLDNGMRVTYASTHGFGYLWKDDDVYHAEVWRYGQPVDRYESADISEVLDSLYTEWPDDGFAY